MLGALSCFFETYSGHRGDCGPGDPRRIGVTLGPSLAFIRATRARLPARDRVGSISFFFYYRSAPLSCPARARSITTAVNNYKVFGPAWRSTSA